MTMKNDLKLKNQPFVIALRQLLVGVFLLAIAISAHAQTKTISGLITDENKMGLPGVTIMIKGAKTSGTVSDFDGSFKIKASPKDQLVFTYVGFNTKTITVGERTTINVVMEVSTNNLEEIVVVGYGTRKRGDLTGSVSKAPIGDMQRAPVRSIDEALAGRVAGVQVTSGDGQPGSGIDIVIRGNNSVTQSNSPLYVVDGFILENPNNNVINPKDVESFEVLKDASATAIYGARGANGVIVITTKKGKKGRAVFNFDSSYGFQEISNKQDLMSSYDFVKLQLELDPNLTSTPYKSATELYLTDPGRTLDYYKDVPATDWESKITQTAPMQNYNLSVSGGNDNTKYLVSGSYFDQDGIIINSNYKRYQGRIAIDQNINKKLKVGFNMNYTQLQQSGISPSQSQFSAMTNVMYSVWGYRPFSTNTTTDYEDSLFDPDVNPNNDYRTNPVINLDNLYRLNTTQNFYSNAYLDYAISPSLKLRVTNGVTENRVQSEAFNNSRTQYGYPGHANGVNGSINNTQLSNWLNENTLTWKHKFNKHNLDVLGGMTFQKQTGKRYGRAAILIPNEELGLAGLDQGVQQRVDTFNSLSTMASFLTRVNYDYGSRYYLTASMRADGSSKFPSQNHWGYFPSGAFAWKFKNEKFLKKSNVLSEGKLRISYGETGNNRVGDFDYLSTYFDPVGSSYSFNNQYINGIVATNLGNDKLKWETTEQTDLGLDLGFFDQRISFTAEVYRKKTNDLLLRANLPSSSGFATAIKNVGAMQNEGLEFTLNTVNVKNSDFNWSTSFNISFNRNEVLALADGQQDLQSTISWDSSWRNIPAYIAKKGEPIGLMYGYVWEGTYKQSDFNQDSSGNYTILKPEITTNGNTRANIRPGDIKYKDLNGDLVVNAKDYTVIGSGLPKHIGGFTNNFTYKGFDLNVFFQWSYGNDILNANRIIFEGTSSRNLNQLATYSDRWTPENPDSNIYRANGAIGALGGYSSRTIEDGSYIRLKTVSFGYNFNDKLTNQLHLKSLRLYASGQNLLTWTKYSGPDPEVNTYSSALTTGFDYSAYPRARIISFGLNATF